jgi:hypothetical protein
MSATSTIAPKPSITNPVSVTVAANLGPEATDRRALFFPFSLLKQYRTSNQTAPLSECTRMLTGLMSLWIMLR